MITVHLIPNAHLDPIWLWPWQAGLDAALATCRSACDRLDAHPDLTFARGDAWLYRQIEIVDPPLLERIRGHVSAGRWCVVGGWWIQPDCNLPSGWGLAKQIELGKAWFRDRFGVFPRVAFNVDSFGHAASLPGIMRAAGQDRYVMMRPQEHEMALPARLFRWRGWDGGPEVVAFRIARAYCTGELTVEHVRASLADLPAGVEHTMCFLGVGDHGGGPTERQIRWCRDHAEAIEGCRLVFSTPERFFTAVDGLTDRLPIVVGELQHHAVGCYSVHRRVKTGVRRAEHLLRQAEVALQADPAPDPDARGRLQEAWRRVCLHQFHDTLGGTCIPSAYEQVDAQLGLAAAVADETIHYALRRGMRALGDDALQRIVLFNASDEPFDGYAEVEPWLAWRGWQDAWRLLDERGRAVPCQRLASEAAAGGIVRLLLPLAAGPGQIRVLRIETEPAGGAGGEAAVHASPDCIANDVGVQVRPGGEPAISFAGGCALASPRLELLDDPSDTWSHGVARYAEDAAAAAQWEAPALIDHGPLMASLLQTGRVGDSRLRGEFRVYAGAGFAQWRLRVHWAERHKLLKLVLPLPAACVRRTDGIPGGELFRPPDGNERPVRDWTLLELAGGLRLGVVCPEAFALDAAPHRVRLTLLRSPLMAHHHPHPPAHPRGTFADQGVHTFRLRLLASPALTGRDLDLQAMMMQRPLVAADLTRGMPGD